jgi:hypothetical protein
MYIYYITLCFFSDITGVYDVLLLSKYTFCRSQLLGIFYVRLHRRNEFVLASCCATAVRSPAEAHDFSSSLCVQTSCEVHPASYPMGTGGTFLGLKGGRGETLTSARGQELAGAITLLPLAACMAVAGQLYFTLLQTVSNSEFERSLDIFGTHHVHVLAA